ncbi:NAD(P)H-dependent oxidoreductase [Chloroflexota bacterium]
MNLYGLLQQREAAGKPIRVGAIGTGVAGASFLSQLRFIPGMQLVGVAELDMEKAKENCIKAGWPEDAISFGSSTNVINEGSKKKGIILTDDAEQLIRADLDVILEMTGNVEAGAYHAWTALQEGKHVVMVTVEADALLGKALKELADEKGLVYSLGYGDQPALICDEVDWARTSGFEVVCAGEWFRHYPDSQYYTPDTGWKYYGLSEDQVATGDYNLKMYCSFVDGTKSTIEMCAVANACDLVPQSSGLSYLAVEYEDLPAVLKPKSEGGMLEHSGTVETLSSLKPDGTPLKRSFRFGVYVVFKGRSDRVRHYLSFFGGERRIVTDSSGEYAIIYRPTHLIGLELGISVASASLLGVPTGAPSSFVAEVATVAKKELNMGDILDGEGGYAVYGRLVPAEQSLKGRYLPMGLSNKTQVIRQVAKDSIITYDDVAMDESRFCYQIRKKIEKK